MKARGRLSWPCFGRGPNAWVSPPVPIVHADMTGVALGRSLSVAVAERIARRLGVLGQPVRIRSVVALSSRGGLSVSELAEAVGVSVHDVSQHLAVMQAEGVVRSVRVGRRVRYWLDDPSAVAVYELVLARMREQVDSERRELLDPSDEGGRGHASCSG